MHTTMKGAVAGADITPEPGPVLQGHFNAPPSTGVLYPLELRVGVFASESTRVALVTVDAIGLSGATTDEIRRKIEAATGIPAAAVMVACSHTHCAPAALPCLGMQTDASWLNRVVAAAADCVARAAAQLEPISFGLGCGSVHFNISRRPLPGSMEMSLNYGGLVDRRARVLRMDRADGTPLAVCFHYSCHTTTMPGKQGLISPDYAGIARSHIESELGCAALFLPGCFGNVRPAIVDPETGGFTSASKEQLDACGTELGREVVRVTRNLRTAGNGRLEALRQDIAIPFGPPMAVDQLRAWADDTETDLGRLVRSPWANRVLQMLESGTLPQSRATEMQFIRIGPLVCIAIPGEPVQEIGHAMEKKLRPMVAADDVWPVGYSNDVIGYLCTARHYQEGGYEPEAYPYFAEPAPFHDEETVLVDAATELAAQSKY